MLLLASAVLFWSPANAASDCPDCPKLVVIKSVEGGMEPFRLATHEVTWAQYLKAVAQSSCPMPANGYREPLDTKGAGHLADDFPVTGVTHAGIACYIKWINTKSEVRFRLPTPSEWLAAARRAAPAPAKWDSFAMGRSAAAHSQDPREAVNRGYVRPVGSGTPTPEGVFDLEGNAAEMTSSRRSRPRDEICASGEVPCQSTLVFGMGSSDKPELYREAVWAMDGVAYSSIGFRLAAD